MNRFILIVEETEDNPFPTKVRKVYPLVISLSKEEAISHMGDMWNKLRWYENYSIGGFHSQKSSNVQPRILDINEWFLEHNPYVYH